MARGLTQIALTLVLAGAVAARASTALGYLLLYGGEIAFVSDRGGGGDIYLLDLSHRLLQNFIRSRGGDQQPVWLPDGTRLAFFSNREGAWNLYVVDARGRNLRRVSGNRTNYRYAAWSPDSRRLAFASNDFNPGRPTNFIHVAALDGAPGTDIPINLGRLVYDPIWSDDGSRIHFQILLSAGTDFRAESEGVVMRGSMTDTRSLDLSLTSVITDGYTDICLTDTGQQNRRCLAGARGRNVDLAWRPVPE